MGEKQSDRDAVDRMTKRLIDGNNDGSGRMSPDQARKVAVDAARRADKGAVKKRR